MRQGRWISDRTPAQRSWLPGRPRAVKTRKHPQSKLTNEITRPTRAEIFAWAVGGLTVRPSLVDSSRRSRFYLVAERRALAEVWALRLAGTGSPFAERIVIRFRTVIMEHVRGMTSGMGCR